METGGSSLRLKDRFSTTLHHYSLLQIDHFHIFHCLYRIEYLLFSIICFLGCVGHHSFMGEVFADDRGNRWTL